MAAFLTPRRTRPDTSALTALVWLLMAESSAQQPALVDETEDDPDRTVMDYPGSPKHAEAEQGGGNEGGEAGTGFVEDEEQPPQGLSAKVWALVGVVCLVAVLFIGFVGYAYMRARSGAGAGPHAAMQQHQQANVASSRHHPLSTHAGQSAPSEATHGKQLPTPSSHSSNLSTPRLAVQSAQPHRAAGGANPAAPASANRQGGARSTHKLAASHPASHNNATKPKQRVAANTQTHPGHAHSIPGEHTQQPATPNLQTSKQASVAPTSAHWEKLNHKLASIQAGIQTLQKRLAHAHNASSKADADKLASLKKKVAALEKDKGKLTAENKKLHGAVHWLKTVRHRLKTKIAAVNKPAYPDWHVIGFGQHSAVLAGPGQKTKVVRVGTHVFGAKVTKIDAEHGKVVTSHGVFTEAG